MNKDTNNLSYIISWQLPYRQWEPMQVELVPEKEITDFTEANEVLAKIMTK